MGRKAARMKSHRPVGSEESSNLIAISEHRNGMPCRNQDGRVRARTPAQKDYIAAIDRSRVVFGIGPAGTGKTYVACLKAIDMLNDGLVDRIILTRPAVEAEGEKLGFLPGTLQDKLHPYLLPIFDILHERLGSANISKMMGSGVIEISPLAFMRGRTFNRCAVVLDEMQNATFSQCKMALTRIGHDTRLIMTGDPSACDLDTKESGLVEITRRLQGAPGIDVVTFETKDVVRDEMVRLVLERLE